MAHAGTATWRNWAGNVTARPVRQATPADVAELSAVVRRAAEDGLKVKAVGTGHSFTAAAATDGLLVRPDLLTGIRSIDPPPGARGSGTTRGAADGPGTGTVTVGAGTPLKQLNVALAREGLSLTNMGDTSRAPSAPAPTAPAATPARSRPRYAPWNWSPRTARCSPAPPRGQRRSARCSPRPGSASARWA